MFCKISAKKIWYSWVSFPSTNLQTQSHRNHIGGYKFKNGEGGIRTHDGLRHNCLAGSPVQPLLHLSIYGGGSRIRTHGGLRHNGFQDRRFRPLSHPTIYP